MPSVSEVVAISVSAPVAVAAEVVSGPVTETVVTQPEPSPAGGDTVVISAEGAAAAGATDGAEKSVAIWYPWPPVAEQGTINWLLDNLRQREYVRGEMFRLQGEASLEHRIGQYAADDKGPKDIRKEADELSSKGKLEEANKLYDLANQMEWRGIPEDDPATPANEREVAGDLLIQQAADKRMVASFLGLKLERMEEAFQEAAKKVSLAEEVYPYPIYYARYDAVPMGEGGGSAEPEVTAAGGGNKGGFAVGGFTPS